MGNCLGRIRVARRGKKIVAPASGGSGPNGQGGNNIPPLEEEVDVLSTSTASFRSEEPANEENGGIGATGGAEGPVRFDGEEGAGITGTAGPAQESLHTGNDDTAVEEARGEIKGDGSQSEPAGVRASTSAQGTQKSAETTAAHVTQTQAKEVDRPEPPAAEPQIPDSGADASPAVEASSGADTGDSGDGGGG